MAPAHIEEKLAAALAKQSILRPDPVSLDDSSWWWNEE
jgi:hypothetical protein